MGQVSWRLLQAALAAAGSVLALSPSAECQTASGTGPGQSTRPPVVQKGASPTVLPFHAAPRPVVVKATAVRLFGDDRRTHLELDLTGKILATAQTLSGPHRVIIDMPEIDFQLGPGAARQSQGLVTALRHGPAAARKSQIVLDVKGPVEIVRVTIMEVPPGDAFRLVVNLAAVGHQGADAARAAVAEGDVRMLSPSLSDHAATPARTSNDKPVIVLDPGHGGNDPGAIGNGNLLEKDVVLAVARQVETELAAGGRYKVLLTRTGDVSLPLRQRLTFSQTHAANLFISLHADALADANLAQAVRGATIYTLSERASDEQARRFAEKENASDLVAGLEGAEGSDHGEMLRGILVDLVQRETANFSSEFRKLLIGKMKGRIALAREARRSAAFTVLKQTHTPAVLVELGYMRNAEDEKLFKSEAWQQQIAKAIAAAVDQFFAKQAIGGRR